MITVHERVNQALAAKITEAELLDAVEAAEKKLKRIIEREGDDGGARLTTDYIARLVVEAVREKRYERLTLGDAGEGGASGQ